MVFPVTKENAVLILQVLCIQNGIALLDHAELELCHYLAELDEYVPVKCSLHQDAVTGHLLIFVVISCKLFIPDAL